jgi:hypothetical protein
MKLLLQINNYPLALSRGMKNKHQVKTTVEIPYQCFGGGGGDRRQEAKN